MTRIYWVVAVGLVLLAVVVADLGTAIVLGATAALVFFVAGLELRYCAIVAALALTGLVIFTFAKPYRLARVVKQCRDLPGHELFQYVDDDGRRQRIGSADWHRGDDAVRAGLQGGRASLLEFIGEFGCRWLGREDRETILCTHTMDEHSLGRHWPVILSRLHKAGLGVVPPGNAPRTV